MTAVARRPEPEHTASGGVEALYWRLLLLDRRITALHARLAAERRRLDADVTR